MLAQATEPVEGVRLVIRTTARTSLALFLAAFLASSLARIWPGGFTSWLVANRRWFGLSFAWSHLVHAVAIIALVQLDPALFWTLSNPVSIAGGSTAYLFIALLAATSYDRMVKAIGPQRWAKLHRTGIWVIWLVFFVSNAKRIPGSGWYALPVAILLAAAFVRLRAPRLAFSRRKGTALTS
jgi:DMSO/TMAO reductase YedYZ heme-binding membrane subunit